MIRHIKIVFGMSLLLLLNVCVMTAYAADNTTGGGSLGIVYSDPAKPIIVKQSEQNFSIILQSNMTTGYSWVLKSYDSNLIKPVSRRYYPSPNRKLIGAGGYEKWVFKVKPEGFIVPQTTSITLIYSRAWEQQGAQVTSFRVVTFNDN